MTNFVHPAFLTKCLTADVDWLTDTYKVALMDIGYTVDAETEEFVDDLPPGSIIIRSDALTGKTVVDGVADAADTVVTPGAGLTVGSVWVFRDTSSDATSELVAYMDTDDSGAAMEVLTDGGDLTVRWSELTNKVFRI